MRKRKRTIKIEKQQIDFILRNVVVVVVHVTINNLKYMQLITNYNLLFFLNFKYRREIINIFYFYKIQ